MYAEDRALLPTYIQLDEKDKLFVTFQVLWLLIHIIHMYVYMARNGPLL
jgi:hypothetical protein